MPEITPVRPASSLWLVTCGTFLQKTVVHHDKFFFLLYSRHLLLYNYKELITKF